MKPKFSILVAEREGFTAAIAIVRATDGYAIRTRDLLWGGPQDTLNAIDMIREVAALMVAGGAEVSNLEILDSLTEIAEKHKAAVVQNSLEKQRKGKK